MPLVGKPQIHRPNQVEEARNVLEALCFRVAMDVHIADHETFAAELKPVRCG